MTDTPSNSIYVTTSLGDLLETETKLVGLIKAWEFEEGRVDRMLRLHRGNLLECRAVIRQRLKEHRVRLDTLERKDGS